MRKTKRNGGIYITRPTSTGRMEPSLSGLGCESFLMPHLHHLHLHLHFTVMQLGGPSLKNGFLAPPSPNITSEVPFVGAGRNPSPTRRWPEGEDSRSRYVWGSSMQG